MSTSAATLEVTRARRALGAMPSSVAVIATAFDGRLHGCTSWAWGEDPDPPLLLTTLRQESRTGALIRRAGRFTVSVLAADQQVVATRFAQPGDRFADVAHSMDDDGLPWVDGSAVSLSCELAETYPFGRQSIFVGRLVRARVLPLFPLIFSARGFAAPASSVVAGESCDA